MGSRSLVFSLILLAARTSAEPDGGATFEIHIDERDLLRAPNATAVNKNVAMAQPIAASGKAAPLANEGTISLKLNEAAKFAIDCAISRIAVGNNGWEVSPAGSHEFVIRGYEEGKSSLMLWCVDGRRRSFGVVVGR